MLIFNSKSFVKRMSKLVLMLVMKIFEKYFNLISKKDEISLFHDGINILMGKLEMKNNHLWCCHIIFQSEFIFKINNYGSKISKKIVFHISDIFLIK